MRIAMLIVLFVTFPLAAQDWDGITGQCAACHGADGMSPWEDIPNIAGLPEIVVANALYDFRGNERPCRKPACAADEECPPLDMCEIARPLSDTAIETLARLYAAEPYRQVSNEFDATLAEEGRAVHDRWCEGCHTMAGTDPVDEASILRGQHSVYIRNAIVDYRSGNRTAEKVMIDNLKKMSDEQLEAVIHFYASPGE